MSEKYLGEVSTPLLINQIKENCAQKRTTLPIASVDELGHIYQYMGSTSGSLVHGYFYECVSDGQNPATYSWQQVNTQPTPATPTASGTTFDNTTSGLQATNVQGAIDEVVDGLGTAASKDFTTNVSPNNHALVESNAVYSAINNALTSVYTPRGNIACADLTSSLLIASNVGNVYNTTDSGTTTALFMQGAGILIPQNSTVGIIQTSPNTYLFNLMGNTIDLHDYQKQELTSAVEGETTVESALGALSANKQDSLTFDNVPTKNSNNPVKSGGVYTTDDKIYQVMGQNSAKNFIPFDLDKIKAKNTTGTWNGNVYSLNGIDFTFNSDGTVDASGTATETASVHYYDPVGLPPFGGDRILRLTGCPSGGSGTTYKVMAYRAGEVDGSTGTAEEYGNGISLKWLNNGSGIKAFISISVYTGAGTIDLTFKPMLRLSTDTDNTFAPYAKTNQQLTAENEALTNQLTNEVTTRATLGAHNLFGVGNSLGEWFAATNDGKLPTSYLASDTITGTVDKDTNSIVITAYNNTGYRWGCKKINLKKNTRYTFSRTSCDGTIQLFGKNNADDRAVVVSGLSNGGTVNSGDYDWWYIGFYPTRSGGYFSITDLLVRLETDADTTYQPYAKTNQQLTEDSIDWDNFSELGAVNMLPNTATTQTINGVTFTVNSDGTVTANGTATANAVLKISDRFTLADYIGRKYVNAKKNEASSSTYSLIITYRDGSGAYVNETYVPTEGFILSTISNATLVEFGVFVKSGQSVSNLTFKPMITVASYNGPYVPHAKTNRELTEDVTSLDAMYDGKTPSAVSDLNVPLTAGGASVAITRHLNNTTNAPTNGGGLEITWSSSDRYGAQLTLTDSGLYFRTNSSGTISAWQKIST